ncbi:MAG: MerC domain-containing protein [Bdellovibrio sp.]
MHLVQKGEKAVSVEGYVETCSQAEENTGRWDKVGIFLSTLCALHCLATPLLILILPVLGEVFEQEWVHVLMALFVVPIGLYAFWSGYQHHRQKSVLALGLIGLVLVGGASVMPHEWIDFLGHDLVTITGSVFLILGHVLNRRVCSHSHTHAHSHATTSAVGAASVSEQVVAPPQTPIS